MVVVGKRKCMAIEWCLRCGGKGEVWRVEESCFVSGCMGGVWMSIEWCLRGYDEEWRRKTMAWFLRSGG